MLQLWLVNTPSTLPVSLYWFHAMVCVCLKTLYHKKTANLPTTIRCCCVFCVATAAFEHRNHCTHHPPLPSPPLSLQRPHLPVWCVASFALLEEPLGVLSRIKLRVFEETHEVRVRDGLKPPLILPAGRHPLSNVLCVCVCCSSSSSDMRSNARGIGAGALGKLCNRPQLSDWGPVNVRMDLGMRKCK